MPTKRTHYRSADEIREKLELRLLRTLAAPFIAISTLACTLKYSVT